MKLFRRRKQHRLEEARLAAKIAAAEKAGVESGCLVREARSKLVQAQELNAKATAIDREIRAEIRQNAWTNTLFGISQTGRPQT